MKVLPGLLSAGALLVVVSSARGDVFRAPATGIVLPDDGSGVAKVALRFNVLGLRDGVGLTIQSAFVKCEFPSMSVERKTAFRVYGLTRPWGILGPDAFDVIDALDSGPESGWDVFPQDIERMGRRLMKLDVTRLAQERIDSNQSELSVLIATSDIPRQELLDRLAHVQLEVRYGFLGALAPLSRTAN